MLRKFIFHRGLVTDGCVSVDPLDGEIIERLFKKDIREGEEKLLLAVLADAIEHFQKEKEDAAIKIIDDVRKLRDRIRPAPGNLQREQFDLGKIPFTVP